MVEVPRPYSPPQIPLNNERKLHAPTSRTQRNPRNPPQREHTSDTEREQTEAQSQSGATISTPTSSSSYKQASHKHTLRTKHIPQHTPARQKQPQDKPQEPSAKHTPSPHTILPESTYTKDTSERPHQQSNYLSSHSFPHNIV